MDSVAILLTLLVYVEWFINTAGYWASVPRETNAALAGRAGNRRVDLTRR